ncbi:hypothetical protein ACOSP7_023980 [Xanthoceras sorbifolium]
MIFTRTSISDVQTLKGILGLYARALGQIVNFDKSAMCYNKQISRFEGLILARALGVNLVPCHERYLGLPSFASKDKKGLFANIRDRVWGKLKGWNSSLFSAEGREVLIKAVVQAIPTYSMNLFKLPLSLIKELNVLCARFWWRVMGI